MEPRLSIDELYERAGPLVTRRCTQMLGDPQEALDVAQWTFLRAIEIGFEIRTLPEALAWLYQTSTRRCLWLLRNQRTRRRLRTAHGDHLRALPDRHPEHAAADRDLVHRVLKEVDERTGEVALLTWLQGMTNHRAAEILGISVRTVGRARADFESLLRIKLESA
ncbi:MAG: sigma-70 family RNA polymerase sigma factor [Myxococcota bacterium]